MFILCIASYSSTEVWLGMSSFNALSVDTYTSVDNTIINFANWQTGEPSMGARKCVSYVQGKWYVRTCNEEHLFVCEETSTVVGVYLFKWYVYSL